MRQWPVTPQSQHKPQSTVRNNEDAPGQRTAERKARHMTATYHDLEHQESVVQELTSARALQRTTRRTTQDSSFSPSGTLN